MPKYTYENDGLYIDTKPTNVNISQLDSATKLFLGNSFFIRSPIIYTYDKENSFRNRHDTKYKQMAVFFGDTRSSF